MTTPAAPIATGARSSAMRRGPRASLLLGAAFVAFAAGLAVAVDGPNLLIGFAVVAWVMSYSLGSTAWAATGAATFFGSVAAGTDDPTLLGLVAALSLLAIVQMERSVSMRRKAQPDDRVRRTGIVMLALVLFASFFIIGMVQLVMSDTVAGFQLPLGLAITAVVVAIVARLLDRSSDTSNATTFRPGTRH